jgi:outer membrane lipoprotein-sorting protein
MNDPAHQETSENSGRVTSVETVFSVGGTHHMRYRTTPTALALAFAAAGIALSTQARAIDSNIKSYVCDKLDDFSATMSVVSVNERAMGKISKDAVMLYKLGTVNMRYKEPNKVRIEGNAQGSHAVFILSGSTQWVSLNGAKFKRDFGKSPGKRKSLMDVGLVSDYYLTYTNAKFVREGAVDGTPCGVFELTYKDRDEDTSHAIVYIDPKTKVVRKREAYSQDGKLQAVYFYKNVEEVKPGIWFPTLIEAQNVDRVIAGSTAYKNIKVNTGLDDSIFKL